MADHLEAVPFARVPDHELIQLIGKGSYGEVWLARTAVGTYRAVKIVYEETFRHKRPFEREFNGVQKFEPISRLHEGLVDILQIGRNEPAGYFYCVMELADDIHSGQAIDPNNYSPRTLAHDIARHKRLPVEQCLRLGVAIASALGFVHRHGLIHRDLKPSNIVFVNGIPKLADIGLVAELSEAKSYVGTEGFIPPEGPGTVQADIYSFGKVLYEISTGKDRRDYPELPPPLDDALQEQGLMELNKIILTACRADPAQRYPSAKAMIADFLRLQKREPLSSPRIRRGVLTPAVRAGLTVASLAILAGLFLLARSKMTQVLPRARASSAPIPAGLVGWWRAEGNALDSAGTNDGELYGVGFVPGKVGQAFDFIPARHRVRVPDNVAFKLTNSLTIEAWIFMRTGEGIIVQRGDRRAGFDPYTLDAGAPGQITFEIESETEATKLAAPIVYNEWKFVAATLDGTTGEMKIYVDGTLAAKTNTVVRPLGNLDSKLDPFLCLGNVADMGYTFAFNGLIDELSLYSRALSEREIRTLYESAGGKRMMDAPWRARTPETRAAISRPEKIPAPIGRIGWWPGEADARDQSGTNDGILMGGATFAPGIIGQAFRLDGTNAYVKIPVPTNFDVGNQITLEFWMKADTDNPMNVCCQGLVGADSYSMEIGPGSTPGVGVNFVIYGDGSVPFADTADANNGGAVISSGVWHHVAGTYDGTQLQLYIDGLPRGKPAIYSGFISPPPANGFLAIGSQDGRTTCSVCIGARYFKGLIDEVSIYNRALSRDEVAGIYYADTGGKTPPSP